MDKEFQGRLVYLWIAEIAVVWFILWTSLTSLGHIMQCDHVTTVIRCYAFTCIFFWLYADVVKLM